MNKFCKVLKNVVEAINDYGINTKNQYKQNVLDQAIGFFGSSGPSVNIEYHRTYGEFPHETESRQLNIDIQLRNQNCVKDQKKPLVTFH